jgi:1-acyl-sn-glycerol-3-phosphate acyltransferase
MRKPSELAPIFTDQWKPSTTDVLRRPLTELALLDRTLVRSLGLCGQTKLLSISGLTHVACERDPFILALNHNSKLEALLVPVFLMLIRQGRRVHFLADWNFRLIPGVGLLYSRSGAITVARKPARPRFLTPLRDMFRSDVPPMEQARRALLDGRSVGIFPEGTINRDPYRLLRGRRGVARLSLETGMPVIPAGIRFQLDKDAREIPEGAAMELRIGAPLVPSAAHAAPSAGALSQWHSVIMQAIAEQSGKSYRSPKADV